MREEGSMTICLDARLVGGQSGGIELYVIGLAAGLAKLPDEGDRYVFLCWEGHEEWLAPYIGGPCRIDTVPAPPSPSGLRSLLARGPRFLRTFWDRLSPLLGRGTVRVPHSDGTVEERGYDLMHFTTQAGFLTDLPTIYQPHDLQHVHLPQFFTPRDRMSREHRYATLCHASERVLVNSRWGQRDVQQRYDLPEGRVRIIPYAPVIEAYPEPDAERLAAVRRELNLPERFIFFPAQTWPHKNHLAVIEAMHRLREEKGLEVHFVSSGKLNDFYPKIVKRVRRLGLEDQVHFKGFVSAEQLQGLYRLATAAVIPTRFEAASFPLWEAFLAGTPAACSNVTSLPGQAGDSALVFDPDDVSAIADSIERLWTDASLRGELVRKGRENVARFSWELTAKHLRAHYRDLLGRELSEEDRILLAAAPFF